MYVRQLEKKRIMHRRQLSVTPLESVGGGGKSKLSPGSATAL